MTLTPIDPNNLISDGPSDINANFALIETNINDLLALLSPSSTSLKLTNLATIPAGSVESATITVTRSSGNVITVSPGGGAATYTVTFDGRTSGLQFIGSGTGSDASSFADLNVTGTMNFTGPVTMNQTMNLNQTNSRLALKYRTVALVDANTGSSATQPVDISRDIHLRLDYNNAGVALANSGEVKLDTSSMVDGQVVRVHCYRSNTSTNMKFYNGAGVGSEVFAYINPAGSGYTSIAHTVKPAFTPSTTPDTQSWMDLQWVNIGGGTFRLVVIDSKNATGVS